MVIVAWIILCVCSGLMVLIGIDQFCLFLRRKKQPPAGVPVRQYLSMPNEIGEPLHVWVSDSAEMTNSMFSGCSLARAYCRSCAPGPVGSVEWLKGFAEFIVSIAEEQQHSEFEKECGRPVAAPAPGPERAKVLHFKLQSPRGQRDTVQILADEYVKWLHKQPPNGDAK